MTDKRYAEIAADKRTCEFCLDLGNDAICMKCQKVQSITMRELQEFWSLVSGNSPVAQSCAAKMDGDTP